MKTHMWLLWAVKSEGGRRQRISVRTCGHHETKPPYIHTFPNWSHIFIPSPPAGQRLVHKLAEDTLTELRADLRGEGGEGGAA